MADHLNATSVLSPLGQDAISLAQLVHFQGLLNPELPALVIANHAISYGDLIKKTQQIANLLKINNIKRLGILASKTVEAYVGVLAAHWIGIAYVPLNPSYPMERLKNIITSAQLDGVMVDELRLEMAGIMIANFEPTLKSINLDNRASIAPENVTPNPVGINDLAYLLFTSGSTGEPKGVPIAFGNLTSFIKAQCVRYPLTSADRISQFSSLSFDVSVFDMCMAFAAGAALYVVPEYTQMAPAKFIYDNKLTVWLSVPSIINNMARLNMLRANGFSTLKYSLFTGEVLTLAQAQWWMVAAPTSKLENLYGPTEATIDCLGQIYQKQDEQEYYREQIAIGKPFNHMMAALIDEDEKFLGTNNKGELVLAGPQVASGYWHNTALSTQKFKMLTHPKWGMQRWFLTGDYCFQDSEGIFHYIKRLDNQCKILGNRIELEEIEFQVRNLAGCTDAVACLINNGAEKEIAVIMNSIILDRELLLKQLKDRLPSYMLPSCILYREALLYNVHGKIDRAALAEWAAHNIDGGIGNAAC